MELINRPFFHDVPGYLLTIGGHSVRLLREDLCELSRLVNAALEEVPPPSVAEQLAKSDDARPVKTRSRSPLISRLLSMAVGDTIDLTVTDAHARIYVSSACCRMKRVRGLVFKTKTDRKTQKLVILRVE